MQMSGETNGKRTRIVAFKMDEDEGTAMSKQIKAHSAETQSDYFRGLLYLDVMLSQGDTNALEKPKWVSQAYPALFANIPSANKTQSGANRGAQSKLRKPDPRYRAAGKRARTKSA